MKAIFNKILALSIATLAFVSCSSDDSKAALATSQRTDVVFQAFNPEPLIVAVATDQTTWEAISDQEWCVITQDLAKSQFTITAKSNLTETPSVDATVIVTAPGASPITFKVSQIPFIAPEVHVADAAECKYWGNAYRASSGVFNLDLYNGEPGATNFEGLQIQGSTNYQRGEVVKLIPGIYPVGSIMAKHSSIHIGTPSLTGSHTYTILVGANADTPGGVVQTAAVTGGYVEIQFADGIYTIIAKLTAKDPITNQPSPNIINWIYRGPITIVNASSDPSGDNLFTDIAASNYSAKGFPALSEPAPVGGVDTNGYTTWTGTITPKTYEFGERYAISNWGGVSAYGDVLLEFGRGWYTVDASEPIMVLPNGNSVYFQTFYITPDSEGVTGSIMPVLVYPVFYNSSTFTLDFTGEEAEGKYYAMGIVEYLKNEKVTPLTNFYARTKLVLGGAGRAASFSGQRVDISAEDLAKIDVSNFKNGIPFSSTNFEKEFTLPKLEGTMLQRILNK